MTPYLRAYDLALALLTIAVLLSGTRVTVLEKAVVFAAWLLPAYLMFVPQQVQFGPLVCTALLVTLLWRVFSKEPGMGTR